MKISKSIFYFLCGAVAIICFLPILQSFSEIICSICEVVKSKLNIFISQNNIETQAINISEKPKNVIGFGINSNEEDDCEEDRINPIGFGGDTK